MNEVVEKDKAPHSEEEIDTKLPDLEQVVNKHRSGDLDSAKKGYQALIDANHAGAAVYSNLAALHNQKREHLKAMELLEKAIQVEPDYVDAYLMLGCTIELYEKDLDKATNYYLQALDLSPDNLKILNIIGTSLFKRKQYLTAIDYFEKIVLLQPNDSEAHYNLGICLMLGNRLDEACVSFQKTLDIDKYSGGALSSLWYMRMRTSDWSDYSVQLPGLKKSIYNIIEHTEHPDIANTLSPFPLLGIFDDPELMHLIAKQYFQARTTEVALTEPLYKHRNRKHGDIIKIAFLATDYHNHPTTYLVAELFELLDPELFEIHVIAHNRVDENSEIRERIKSTSQYYYDVTNEPDEVVAHFIAGLDIDIAVDLKGLTEGCRPGILALRPAPVQVRLLGFPGTTGTDSIDYFIADPVIIPEEEQSNYSENIMYMPDSYQINDRKRAVHPDVPTREACGLPKDAFVYCTFNHNFKITPEVFDIWMELLEETPGSVLWLLESNQWAGENLINEAKARGVDPSRIIFAELLPSDKHLARIQNADLFLDNFPCNAHTTASDALWVGLPVLTCMGKSMAARVAASILKAVDLEELITTDFESYKALALELAHNPKRLDQIKLKLKTNRDTCSLFDTETYTKNLQKGFIHMLDIHEAGIEAESFYVSDLKEDLLPKLADENLPIEEMNNGMRINIAIIHFQGTPIRDTFKEIAETLCHSFIEIGFVANITENTLIEDGINIILGVHRLMDNDIELIPASSIIYNFEQITDTSKWMTPALFDLFNKFTVWDYSKKNIASLKDRGITKNIHHVPVGYNQCLTRIPKAEAQDIDVLFYGSINDRRQNILDTLTEAGLKVETLFGVYGAERDEYIARSKVIVNIHFYDSNIFEQVRVSYLLANKKAVVSEYDVATEINDDMKDAVALVPYDQIVDKCLELVSSDELRLELEEKGFEIIKSRDATEYLNNALQALGGDSDTESEINHPVKINIGSGKDFKEDCLNIDISENSNPDVIADLSDQYLIGKTLKSKRFGDIIFTENQFDEIIANDVLEHIPDLVTAMTNCLHLLKVGGQFKISVPYDLSYGAWQDPTHVRAFNERSWLYYTDWFWYLDWDEARFDMSNIDFSLSPAGTQMQQEGKSTDQILTQPRAVDSMSVILTKRLLTAEEKAAGLHRMAGV